MRTIPPCDERPVPADVADDRGDDGEKDDREPVLDVGVRQATRRECDGPDGPDHDAPASATPQNVVARLG